MGSSALMPLSGTFCVPAHHITPYLPSLRGSLALFLFSPKRFDYTRIPLYPPAPGTFGSPSQGDRKFSCPPWRL